MILATDIQYHENSALAAGLLFLHWESHEIEHVLLKKINNIEPYESGQFFKRELPCILSLLEDLEDELDAIIIDGFVSLGAAKKDGLGMHLFNALEQSIPIIGVAKNAFKDTPKECQIIRGKSLKPLYVTSVGLPLKKAKCLITNMHGKNRIPSILKAVDRHCRGLT